MSKHKHKKNLPKVSKLNRFFDKRVTIVFLLILVCLIGLPLRTQNIKLDGYISDDAWWHSRQVSEIIETGKRLNPDIYEFTTLNRPMTYPPLFHYLVAYSYKFVSPFLKGVSLYVFSHYFNILEGLLYILIIYWISLIITADALFSVIGALAASVAYGIIIRARAGELMAFVPSDLLALAGAGVFIYVLKDFENKRAILFSLIAGVLYGLSTLSWNGAVLIYLPLAISAFLALIIDTPARSARVFKLFLVFLAPFLLIFLPWYLPLALKHGINPHLKEMDWFMKNFTVSHQVKPLIFYIFTSGIAIFFVPVVLLSSFFRKNALNIFLIFWIILCIAATFNGWRGYVAVGPIISCVAISVGVSRIARSWFKEGSVSIPIIFIALFLLVGISGYRISSVKLKALNPEDVNEVRANNRSIKMLKYLKANYYQAVTVDTISWISEDSAVGKLRMVAGQYLEFMPKGSSEALKDISRIYLNAEEEAYKLCLKYNVDLIIVRKQLMQLNQLSILFAPPELNSQDYLSIKKESPESREITVAFTPLGMQSMYFRMLNRMQLEKFEMIYVDQAADEAAPFVVVYKVIK